jgi:Tfp pilus assembly protein PilN
MELTSINLVRGRKPHFFDQFVSWALTIGRGLVILTEMVALGAFLYRFGLDRQLVDLHDKIVQQQNIVRFLKKTEDSYRNLQSRLSLAQTIVKNEDQTVKSYLDITNLIPSDMSVTDIIFSQKDVKIDADIRTINTLTTFISNLKSYPNIESVSINKIENKTTTAIISISVTALFHATDTTKL